MVYSLYGEISSMIAAFVCMYYGECFSNVLYQSKQIIIRKFWDKETISKFILLALGQLYLPHFCSEAMPLINLIYQRNVKKLFLFHELLLGTREHFKKNEMLIKDRRTRKMLNLSDVDEQFKNVIICAMFV